MKVAQTIIFSFNFAVTIKHVWISENFEVTYIKVFLFKYFPFDPVDYFCNG